MIQQITKHQKENIKKDTNNMENLGIVLLSIVSTACIAVVVYQLYNPLNKRK